MYHIFYHIPKKTPTNLLSVKDLWIPPSQKSSSQGHPFYSNKDCCSLGLGTSFNLGHLLTGSLECSSHFLFPCLFAPGYSQGTYCEMVYEG